MVLIKIKRLRENAIIPSYASIGDAGMDFYSCENYLIQPTERRLVSTGLALEFPLGYELQLRPRSGLALKRGISLVNSPATIDAGYRGEIGIILINHGQEDFLVSPGDKIAQGVLSRVERADFVEVSELEESVRGEGGFGSSGGHSALG